MPGSQERSVRLPRTIQPQRTPASSTLSTGRRVWDVERGLRPTTSHFLPDTFCRPVTFISSCSRRVFHWPHSGHWPDHLSCVWWQLEQVNIWESLQCISKKAKYVYLHCNKYKNCKINTIFSWKIIPFCLGSVQKRDMKESSKNILVYWEIKLPISLDKGNLNDMDPLIFISSNQDGVVYFLRNLEYFGNFWEYPSPNTNSDVLWPMFKKYTLIFWHVHNY